MLTELRVRNLAVIADVTLQLHPGLNVITGETGAGKSILVDALALLLGERATADLLRPGASKAVVEAAFEIRHDDIVAKADTAGVELEDHRLIVRRDINAAGKNRAWANGSPTTVGVLSELGRVLVDLHGQHESQSLLKAGAQRDILDAFAGAEKLRASVRKTFEQVQALRAEEENLAGRRDEVLKRADYIRHVVHEIETVAPSPDEDEHIAAELKRLSHAEDLSSLAGQVVSGADGDEQSSVSASLASLRRSIDLLARIDEKVADRWQGLVDAAAADIEELSRDAYEYQSQIDGDPSRLAELERRQDQVFRLLQKYGTDVAAVLDTLDECKRELELLDRADFDLARIRADREHAEEALQGFCRELSEARTRASKRLAKSVDVLLPTLGMLEGKFTALVQPREQAGATGADAIAFLVRLNQGMSKRPLAQVASGGELSRIMLALKVVLAQHDVIPTLIFDEVDQGIGAEVGSQVAEALVRVAKNRQVLVITHMAQIAARADHHVVVEKGVDSGIASTNVAAVAGAARRGEIARMLGNADDPIVMRHAEDLLTHGSARESPRRRKAVARS